VIEEGGWKRLFFVVQKAFKANLGEAQYLCRKSLYSQLESTGGSVCKEGLENILLIVCGDPSSLGLSCFYILL